MMTEEAPGEPSLFEVFETWIERYKADRSPSPNTMNILRSFVGRFLAHCQAKGRPNLNMITREDVIEWLNSLVEVRTSTRIEAASLITMFFNRAHIYGMREHKMPAISYRGPSDVPRTTIKGFTVRERKTMMENISKLGTLEKAVYFLLSMRPMRQSELLNMKVQDIDLEERTITISHSKNRGTRIITIPKEAYDAISDLIRDKSQDDAAFPLASRTMNRFINGIITKLGVKRNGRSSHAFRHTVIVQMLRTLKLDPATIADVAGNSTKTIYEHYDKDISTEERIDAQAAMDKLARETRRNLGRG